MKRLFLSITLVLCAFIAQSQIFVSINAGGSMSSGNTNIDTRISVSSDSAFVVDVPHDKTSTFGGGFRFGYKTGKMMFGIGADYSVSSITTHTLDPHLIPIYPELLWKTSGEMTTKSATITVVPFFRYEVVKAGDISLFAELNAFYAMEQDPTITAHQVYTRDDMPTPLREFDTTFTAVRNATGFGARVTPGLNWQINTYVSLDLYLDFLSIAYASYTRTATTYDYAFTTNNMGTVVDRELTTSTTTTEKSTDIDLGIFGTPRWGTDNPGNFVRVGLNICF